MNEETFNQLRKNLIDAAERTAERKGRAFAVSNCPTDPAGDGTRPQLQEQPRRDQPAEERGQKVPRLRVDTTRTGDPDHKERIRALYGSNTNRFRISIIVSISDNRGRDVNGAASTLLDVLRDTARAFALRSPEKAAWIASRMPFDDSHKLAPILNIVCRQVPPGEEGATVIIEAITPDDLDASVFELEKRCLPSVKTPQIKT